MITKIDDTRFEIDFLVLYRTYIKNFLTDLLMSYTASDFNVVKQHQFDVLFLTPSNLASDFFTTDFFISSLIIDGLQVRGKEDILETAYHDITNIDDQVYFTFEED